MKVDATTIGKLKFAGFEKGTVSKYGYFKRVHGLTFTAYPVSGKSHWSLIIREVGGTSTLTFQRVEHLIDFTERYVRKNK